MASSYETFSGSFKCALIQLEPKVKQMLAKILRVNLTTNTHSSRLMQSTILQQHQLTYAKQPLKVHL